MTFIFFKEQKLKNRIRYAAPLTIDELEHIIFKVGKTAVFDDNVIKSSLLEQAGFISIVNLESSEYLFKSFDNYILLIDIARLNNTNKSYISSKSYILNNERNLNIIKSLNRENALQLLSTVGDSEETLLGNAFYITSNTKAYKEVFDFPEHLDMGVTYSVFKYQDLKYRIEQVWMDGMFDVQYISNEDNNNLIVTDLTFSEYGTLISYAVENKKGSVKSTNLNSLIDTSHVNIDNYHLFFQKINKETLTVIEMLIE
jgi:hypothetical protein